MPAKKLYYVSNRKLEQAERMAEKWTARAAAFYQDWKPGEGGMGTVGYCKTDSEAEVAEARSNEIHEALSMVCGMNPCRAPWDAIVIITRAAEERTLLDSGI